MPGFSNRYSAFVSLYNFVVDITPKILTILPKNFGEIIFRDYSLDFRLGGNPGTLPEVIENLQNKFVSFW